MQLAACAGMDTDMFFAPGGPGASGPDLGRNPYEEARRVCAGCPVAAECLDYAQAVEPHGRVYRYGMFGGHSPAERWALRGAVTAP